MYFTKKKAFLWVFWIIVSFVNQAFAQENNSEFTNSTQKVIDSLIYAYKLNEDKKEVKGLGVRLRDCYVKIDNSLFSRKIKSILKLSHNCGLKWKCVEINLLIGKLYMDKNQDNDAMVFFEKARLIALKWELDEQLGQYYLDLGDFYQRKYQYNKALLNYLKAEEIFQKVGNKHLIVNVTHRISLRHYQDRDYEKAIEGFKKLTIIGKDFPNHRLLINSWNALGLIYRNQKMLDKALDHYQQALRISSDKKDSAWIGILNGNIGYIYEAKGNHEDAKTRYMVDARISHKYKIWGSLANVLSSLGDIYRKQENYKKARIFYDSTLTVCEKYNQYDSRELAYRGLADLLEETGKYKQANQYFRLYLEVKDSLLRRNANNKLQKLELTYKFREQRLEIDRLKNQNALQNAWNIIVILAFVIVVIVALVFYRIIRMRAKTNQALQVKQREILSQNHKLHLQQEEITTQRDAIEKKNQVLEGHHRQVKSSIQAAFTIQNALLPHQQKMERLLKNYFVFYRPRDVVSGDFYWLQKVKNTLYVGVLDCTGHGVPGAFMSLIANTLLDKVLREKNKLVPAEILTQLHIEVRRALRSQHHGYDYGLDMGLLAITPQEIGSFQITFAGAKRPLYYILPHTNSSEVCETSSDRFSIGGNYTRTVCFTDVHLELPPNTMLYLNTDGITDQNNSKRRNYTSARLKKLLQDMHHLPLQEQKNALGQHMDNYMQGTEQRDDMLLIAIKLTSNY